MKHEAAGFSKTARDHSVKEMSDEEFNAWMEALPPCPDIMSIDDETEEDAKAAIVRARADIAAGRYHDHAVVAEWLKTWGTSDRRSFAEWLNARNG